MTTAAENTAGAQGAGNSASTSEPQPKPVKKSRAELQTDAANARAELAATLDAIEDKLNVPKQIGLAADRTGARVRQLANENPVALGAIALGVAAAVGLGVWAIVRAVSK